MRRIRSVKPAADGRYSVVGLPEGEYAVALVTDVEPGQPYDPEFLRALERTASTVSLRDGERTVHNLTLAR